MAKILAHEVVRKINRVLKNQGEMLRSANNHQFQSDLGDYYTAEFKSGKWLERHVNIEILAKELDLIEEADEVIYGEDAYNKFNNEQFEYALLEALIEKYALYADPATVDFDNTEEVKRHAFHQAIESRLLYLQLEFENEEIPLPKPLCLEYWTGYNDYPKKGVQHDNTI